MTVELNDRFRPFNRDAVIETNIDVNEREGSGVGRDRRLATEILVQQLRVEDFAREALRDSDQPISPAAEINDQIKLTDAQKERTAAAVRDNAVLRAQGEAIERVRGPTENYSVSLTALNKQLTVENNALRWQYAQGAAAGCPCSVLLQSSSETSDQHRCPKYAPRSSSTGGR